jgi:DNA-binding response OmpR family regulator
LGHIGAKRLAELTKMNGQLIVPPAAKHKRIVVIYNDLDMLNLMNDTLKLDGFDIIVAVNEDDALDVLNNITPDMVIMDTVTADAHSLHILDLVKKRSDVPIVIVTSDSEMETLRAMFAHGADDLIHKPFDTKVFIARVHAILRRWYHFPKGLLLQKSGAD